MENKPLKTNTSEELTPILEEGISINLDILSALETIIQQNDEHANSDILEQQILQREDHTESVLKSLEDIKEILLLDEVEKPEKPESEDKLKEKEAHNQHKVIMETSINKTNELLEKLLIEEQKECEISVKLNLI